MSAHDRDADALAAIAGRWRGGTPRWARFAVEGVPTEGGWPMPPLEWLGAYNGSAAEPREMHGDVQRACNAGLASLCVPVVDDRGAAPEERARRFAVAIMLLGHQVTCRNMRRHRAMFDRACRLVQMAYLPIDEGQIKRLSADLTVLEGIERRLAAMDK